MELNLLISYIEENASSILQKEYNDQNAFVAVDAVNFTFLDGENTSYLVDFRYSINNIQRTFAITSVAGLPDNLFDMDETEAFAFAVYATNIIIKMTDAIDDEELDELILRLNTKSNSEFC